MTIRNAMTRRWAAWAIAATMSLPFAPALAQESLPLPEREAPSVQQSAQDLAVAERVRDTLMSDMAMEGIQLLVSVVDGAVELLGIARDQAQAERAVQLTRDVPGVTSVVHYIEVEGARPAANRV